jgi:3-hydroxyacyl-[acyl-carrier-protein] dehydratase
MRYILVDRIVDLIPGKSARGTKSVSQAEEIFEHHFPGRPVMPGCLMLEALAQLSGLLLAATLEFRVLPMLLMVDKTKFRRVVQPGDLLALESEMLSLTDDAARFRASAWIAPGPYDGACERRTAVDTQLTLGTVPVEGDRSKALRAKFEMLRGLSVRDEGANA